MRYVMMAVSLAVVVAGLVGCGGSDAPATVAAPSASAVGDKHSAVLADFGFEDWRTGARLVGDFDGTMQFMTSDGVWHPMNVGNALRRHGDRLSCQWSGGGDRLAFVANMARGTCQGVYRGPGGVRGVLLDRPGVE